MLGVFWEIILYVIILARYFLLDRSSEDFWDSVELLHTARPLIER